MTLLTAGLAVSPTNSLFANAADCAPVDQVAEEDAEEDDVVLIVDVVGDDVVEDDPAENDPAQDDVAGQQKFGEPAQALAFAEGQQAEEADKCEQEAGEASCYNTYLAEFETWTADGQIGPDPYDRYLDCEAGGNDDGEADNGNDDGADDGEADNGDADEADEVSCYNTYLVEFETWTAGGQIGPDPYDRYLDCEAGGNDDGEADNGDDDEADNGNDDGEADNGNDEVETEVDLGGNPQCRTAPSVDTAGAALFGAFVQGSQANAATTAEFEQDLGIDLALERRFARWDQDNSQFFPGVRDYAARDEGRVILLSIKPTTRYSWADYGNAVPGQQIYNEILEWAETLCNFEAPLFLSFHHEPSGNANQDQYGTSDDYKAAVRRFHQIVTDAGTRNIAWTHIMTGFSFDIDNSDNRHADHWYPGDDVVDVVAVDPYNFAACHSTDWLSWDEITRNFLEWVALNTPDAPLIVAEFGTVADENDPNRRAEWLADVTESFNSEEWDNLLAASYFWRDGSEPWSDGCDWTFRDKAAAIQELFELAESLRFQEPDAPDDIGNPGNNNGNNNNAGNDNNADDGNDDPVDFGAEPRCVLSVIGNGLVQLRWNDSGASFYSVRIDGVWEHTYYRADIEADGRYTHITNYRAGSTYLIRTVSGGVTQELICE